MHAFGVVGPVPFWKPHVQGFLGCVYMIGIYLYLFVHALYIYIYIYLYMYMLHAQAAPGGGFMPILMQGPDIGICRHSEE